jgi:aerotolerance regulator-like protein
MVFSHPEFLWGLMALFIPIIIHLFDFRKNKKIYFSDIRFLKQVKHSSKKPLKLKQWLILLSRLAFIFFLVMVFAQPMVLTENKRQLVSGIKLIYIDNSPSMSSLVNTKETALDVSKIIGQEIINKFSKSEEIILVHNENLHRFIASSSISESFEKISAITLSDKKTSLNQIGLAISEYQKRNKRITDVFIISDFQKTISDQKLYSFDTAITYWIAPVKIENPNNCVVDSAYFVNTGMSNADDSQIRVVVSNKGQTLKENLPVKVFVGNRQVSAATITIPAYQDKSVSFALGKVSKAEYGYIQIEDYPNTFDNTFYFSVPPKRNLNIFEITGINSSLYIKTVFGKKNLFSVFSNNYQNIDNNLFEKADFVVLNQLENPDVELIQQLKFYAKNGGSVLVIPGIEYDLIAYKNLSPSLVKFPATEKLLLNSPSSQTPFFANIIENSSQSFEMPRIRPVWNWGLDRSAILSFEDGTPYLSEISPNIYLLSAPLIDSLSNFQSHALFVPVMYGLASQSVSPVSQPFTRLGSDYVDVKIDSIDHKDLIKLRQQDLEIIPGKTKVGNNWRLTFPKEIVSTGIYNIELDNRIKGFVGLNLNKKESQLEALNKNDLTNLFLGYKLNFLDTSNSNSTILSSFDGGMALWKYALSICLLFLLIETLLIRFL